MKKKIIYVASGGKGNDEVIAEAIAIKNYLMEKEIKENQIKLIKKLKLVFLQQITMYLEAE